METRSNDPPVIAIVGQTASGKTALALQLATLFPGEVIAADSRTVYKGLDIATAKPTPQERSSVRHHLIDVVEPDEAFTVADFKLLATTAISDIGARHKVAYLVGGTGLYIDAILYDFAFRPLGYPGLRQELEAMSVDELQGLLEKRGIALPANKQNPRHLIRTIETNGQQAARSPLRENTLVLGLSVDTEQLRYQIIERVERMVASGLIDEARRVGDKYGWDIAALQAPGYRAFRQFLAGACNLEEAKRLFVQQDMRLAKRQRTWFKRNPDIHWISCTEEAVDIVTSFLNK